MKIYISIPISGHPLEEVRERADHIKMALSRGGHEVVSPLDIYAGQNPTYADYICYDLRAMLDCDAVFFCDGWDRSCGCRIEHYVARLFPDYGKKDFKLMYEYETYNHI